MTDREKAIVMAFTGVTMLAGEKLEVFYKYAEELMGRPVYSHELANADLKNRARKDFLLLCKESDEDDIAALKKEIERYHNLCSSYEQTIVKMAEAIARKGEKNGKSN